jgi:SAM-dependent methyltransferase
MIEWLDGLAGTTTCPACGHSGNHRRVLTVPSAAQPEKRLTLLACDTCGSGFYDDRSPHGYGGDDVAHYSIKFYVEKGAGIDTMLQPLAGIPFGAASRYLEIGCGFGFSLDFIARRHGATVHGIDPSPLAADGRRRLGLDIVDGYFDRAMADRIGPQDVVYCSELIEHVADPATLLADIGAVLAPGGLLMLTTPAMEAVDPAAPAGMLFGTLSPGFHLTLYTAGALEALLRRHGFAEVRVVRNANSLIAYATRDGTLPAADAAIPADSLIDYFRGRYDASSGDALLRNGFLFRLVKHLAIAGRFAEVEALRDAVDAQFREAYGLDLATPSALTLPTLDGADLATVLERLPLNLAGHLHFRGLAALLHHHDGVAAAGLFAASARLARATCALLAAHRVADGELEATVGTCLNLIVHALRSLPAGPARDALPLAAATLDDLLAGVDGPANLGPGVAADLEAFSLLACDLAADAINTGDIEAAPELAALAEDWAASAGSATPALRDRLVQLRRFLVRHDPGAGLAWLDASDDAAMKAAVAWPQFVRHVAEGNMADAARFEPALAGHAAVRALAGDAVRLAFDLDALSFLSALAAYRGHHQQRHAEAQRIYDMLIAAVETRPGVVGDQAAQVIETLKAGKAAIPPT